MESLALQLKDWSFVQRQQVASFPLIRLSLIRRSQTLTLHFFKGRTRELRGCGANSDSFREVNFIRSLWCRLQKWQFFVRCDFLGNLIIAYCRIDTLRSSCCDCAVNLSPRLLLRVRICPPVVDAFSQAYIFLSYCFCHLISANRIAKSCPGISFLKNIHVGLHFWLSHCQLSLISVDFLMEVNTR